MTDRPWTSGPWSFEWWQHPEKPWWNPKGTLMSGDRTIVGEGYYCEEDVFDWSEEDAALISLAPEMAEAILRLRDEYDTKGEQRAILHAIRVVAPMIDAIGEAND